MGKKLTNKILVIGWDAADWKVINPLIQQGKMPALKRLIDGGVHGRIKTLDPPLSPMLWTSIATGFRADRHGILGFVEPTPNGEGLRPVTSTSRKVKAIWNILNQNGYKSNVVTWWPSNPVEPINGVMVSNLFQGANKPLGEEWKMPHGTIHPESMIDVLKDLRVHPQELTAPMILPFIPNLANDKKLMEDKRVSSVAKILAHAATVHAASTYLMRETEWDFMAVYHDAIDHFSHVAMRYHPPRRPFIDETEFENFNGVVEAGYRFHDMMLERTLELVDDETTVVLLSDHGFHSDHLRPRAIPREPSGPAVEHNPYGILVMKGPGIKHGEMITGASIIDITPTLLTLFGLPVGKDMEGKVLTACFNESIKPEYIDSWEAVEGDSGQHLETEREDPWAAQEALQQLVELGYIDALDDNKLEQVELSKKESQYYLARNLINAHKYHEGIEILESIFNDTKTIRYGKRLASTYLQIGAFTKCEKLVESLKETEKRNFERTKTEKLEKDPNDPFGNQEMEEPMYLEYIEGLLLLARNRPRKALPILEKVQERSPANITLCLTIGQIFLSRKNYKAATKHFIQALAIDEMNVTAHHLLGVCHLHSGKLDEAIEEFLRAIELNFYHARSHFQLGVALYKTGNYTAAVDAFNVAVQLLPGMSKAHQWLVKLYNEVLHQPDKAKAHESFLSTQIIGQVTILTGIPGSGSDRVAALLQSSGVEVLQKEFSNGDENALKLDQSWLDQAKGKIVHLPIQLVHYLPKKFNYKVILVERNLTDAIAEQNQILGKKIKGNAAPLNMIVMYENQLENLNQWVSSQAQSEVHFVHFEDLVQDEKEVLGQLATFMGVETEE